MSASGRSAVRRAGRILTGFGALVVLCGVLAGGPVALLAFAGNPLPDHVPTLAEVGATLTSRDDGRLFLRALAVAGWFGWATFALSVLVELGAQALRRPAPRLPGMSRQQRAAAALVGSVALIVAAAPAASAATVAAMEPYGQSAPPAALASPATSWQSVASTALPPNAAGPAARAMSGGDAPVYRVARGDYLGAVAERYLGGFADYRELARLNRLDDPDRIRPGQLLKLPERASDRGARPHATGRLVARPARPAPPGHATTGQAAPGRATPGQAASGQETSGKATPGRATPEKATPGRATPEKATPGRATPEKAGSGRTAPGQAPGDPGQRQPGAEAPGAPVTVGAARSGAPDRVNRPLAVSAVLAVASIVGAQIGAVLGLRRRPATVRAGSSGAGRGGGAAPAGGAAAARGAAVSGQARAHASVAGELPVGRHRRD